MRSCLLVLLLFFVVEYAKRQVAIQSTRSESVGVKCEQLPVVAESGSYWIEGQVNRRLALNSTPLQSTLISLSREEITDVVVFALSGRWILAHRWLRCTRVFLASSADHRRIGGNFQMVGVIRNFGRRLVRFVKSPTCWRECWTQELLSTVWDSTSHLLPRRSSATIHAYKGSVVVVVVAATFNSSYTRAATSKTSNDLSVPCFKLSVWATRNSGIRVLVHLCLRILCAKNPPKATKICIGIHTANTWSEEGECKQKKSSGGCRGSASCNFGNSDKGSWFN